MGFASYQEDIHDRYFEAGPFFETWTAYLGPKPARREIDEARTVFGNPLDRPRRIIRDFWRYYHQAEAVLRPGRAGPPVGHGLP